MDKKQTNYRFVEVDENGEESDIVPNSNDDNFMDEEYSVMQVERV